MPLKAPSVNNVDVLLCVMLVNKRKHFTQQCLCCALYSGDVRIHTWQEHQRLISHDENVVIIFSFLKLCSTVFI